MACYNVMTLVLNNRTSEATGVQEVLTKFGCIINMRLGLHNAGDACSEEGLIILKLNGEEDEIKKLEKELNGIRGVVAKNNKICS